MMSLTSFLTVTTTFMADATTDMPSDSASKLPVLQMGTALAVSFGICKTATSLTRLFGIQNFDLPVITAIIVILATSFPDYFRPLAATGDAIAVVLMQVTLKLVQVVFFNLYTSLDFCCII